ASSRISSARSRAASLLGRSLLRRGKNPCSARITERSAMHWHHTARSSYLQVRTRSHASATGTPFEAWTVEKADIHQPCIQDSRVRQKENAVEPSVDYLLSLPPVLPAIA